MMNVDIKEIVDRLEHLMYGHNYEVCFGVDIFDGNSQEDFRNCLKDKYPDSKPHNFNLIETNFSDFIEDILEAFNYRGDAGAGLSLSQEQESELKIVQQKYIDFFTQFFNHNTKVFYYPNEEGIPGYPVFWDYRFVIFTDKNKILFIYGSSSD